MATRRTPGCRDIVMIDNKWHVKGEEIKDEATLERIKNLKIPPSWTNVAVSRDVTAKVQAVGLDKAGRWQYKYSAEHIQKAARKKFDRVKLFSRDIKDIRRGIDDGIKNDDARAFLLRLEDKTAIRVGSARDFKAKKKAYGLTTLKNEHVKLEGNRIILEFTAKEGIPARYELEDGVLAKWLRKRKGNLAPGDDLFPDVNRKKLNDYLKELAGGKNYTIKDFRTYHGTNIAYHELKDYGGKVLDPKEKKKVIKRVSEVVSNFLKNTPTMARNSYINPMVWDFVGGL